MREQTTDGRELMTRAQAGDADAFAQLYSRHHADVLRWARIRLPQHAEDIAQDVWTKALRSLSQWRDQGRAPAAWLYTITANLCRDFAVSGHNRLSMPVDFTDNPQWHRPDTSLEADPEGVALIRHLEPVLAAAFDQLQPRQRRALTLRFLHDMNRTEAAAAMGIPVSTLTPLQQRGIDALRALLHEAAGETTNHSKEPTA